MTTEFHNGRSHTAPVATLTNDYKTTWHSSVTLKPYR